MMEAMKGATKLLGSMNKQMNLPALQRIAMEFEKENDIMSQRQEMMDDAVDDVTGLDDEEEEEEVVNKVLDEIGVDLGQSVGHDNHHGALNCSLTMSSSLEKPPRASRSRACRKVRWPKPLEGILAMMICKRDWTACGDDCVLGPFHLSVVRRTAMIPASLYMSEQFRGLGHSRAMSDQ
jgi:hypothetical protein